MSVKEVQSQMKRMNLKKKYVIRQHSIRYSQPKYLNLKTSIFISSHESSCYILVHTPNDLELHTHTHTHTHTHYLIPNQVIPNLGGTNPEAHKLNGVKSDTCLTRRYKNFSYMMPATEVQKSGIKKQTELGRPFLALCTLHK